MTKTNKKKGNYTQRNKKKKYFFGNSRINFSFQHDYLKMISNVLLVRKTVDHIVNYTGFVSTHTNYFQNFTDFFY